MPISLQLTYDIVITQELLEPDVSICAKKQRKKSSRQNMRVGLRLKGVRRIGDGAGWCRFARKWPETGAPVLAGHADRGAVPSGAILPAGPQEPKPVATQNPVNAHLVEATVGQQRK
jgi:hypothetical protein